MEDDKFAKYRAAPRRHAPQKAEEARERSGSTTSETDKTSSKAWMLTAYKNSPSPSTTATHARPSVRPSSTVRRASSIDSAPILKRDKATLQQDDNITKKETSPVSRHNDNSTSAPFEDTKHSKITKSVSPAADTTTRSYKRARRVDSGRRPPIRNGQPRFFALLDLDGTLFHMMPDGELPRNIVDVTEGVVPLPEGAMQQLVAKRTQIRCKTPEESEVLARIDVDVKTRHVMAVRRGTRRLLALLRAAKVDVRVVTANLLGDVAVKALTDREDADLADQVANSAATYQSQLLEANGEVSAVNKMTPRGWSSAPEIAVTVVVDRSAGAKRLPDDIVEALREDPHKTKVVILDDNPTAWESRAKDYIWLVPQFDVRRPLTRGQLDEELSLLDGFADRCLQFFTPTKPKSDDASVKKNNTVSQTSNNHHVNPSTHPIVTEELTRSSSALTGTTFTESNEIPKPPKPIDIVPLKASRRRAPTRSASSGADGERKSYKPVDELDDYEDDDELDDDDLLEKEIEMAYNEEDDEEDEDDPEWQQVLKASRASAARSKRRRRTQDDDVTDAAKAAHDASDSDEEVIGCGAVE